MAPPDATPRSASPRPPNPPLGRGYHGCPPSPAMSISGVLYVLLGVASFALVGFLAWMLAKQWKKPPGSPRGLREGPDAPPGPPPER